MVAAVAGVPRGSKAEGAKAGRPGVPSIVSAQGLAPGTGTKPFVPVIFAVVLRVGVVTSSATRVGIELRLLLRNLSSSTPFGPDWQSIGAGNLADESIEADVGISLVPNSSNINILAVNGVAWFARGQFALGVPSVFIVFKICPLALTTVATEHSGLGTGTATRVTGFTVAVGILNAASAVVAKQPDNKAMATPKVEASLNSPGRPISMAS